MTPSIEYNSLNEQIKSDFSNVSHNFQNLTAQHDTEVRRLGDELSAHKHKCAELNENAGRLESELGLQRKAKEQMVENANYDL